MPQPYYIVPLLVEQPTWGGQYIAEFKSVTDPLVRTQNIGQSFELETNSQVVTQPSAELPYAVATATDLTNPRYVGDTSTMVSLKSVIDQDPAGVLGQRVVEIDGAEMKTLIKFTQARNNSYQVHVKPKEAFGQWQAKPESWYFLEKGLATLGLQANTDVVEYHRRCQEIDTFAQQLSHRVKNGELSVDQARTELKAFIDQDHPHRFVNDVTLQPTQLVDLSEGGIHHSWEVSSDVPLGNIVYEVQLDVKDEFCTLRAFDQGNIKDDGSVRPLAIDDYFQALDSEPSHNLPEQYLRWPQVVEKQEGLSISRLFETPYYISTLISLEQPYQGPETSLEEGTYHHLFVQEGAIEVVVNDQRWPLAKGWSLFIPAALGTYQLVPNQASTVIKTSR